MTKPTPPTTKLQQRISLPAAFVLEADSDCKRIGLSLPIALGLAARQHWPLFLRSFVIAAHSLPAPPASRGRAKKARAAK